jgi:hypothetical protein
MEPPWLAAQQRHKARQPADVLAMNLDKFERLGIRRSGKPRIDCCMRGFDERGFAHAAGAPEERIVGREALCEALRIAEKNIASLVDAAQQPDIDPIDARNRDKRRGPSGENERVGGAEIAGRGCASEPLKRGGDPFQRLGGGVIAGKLWAVFCFRLRAS